MLARDNARVHNGDAYNYEHANINYYYSCSNSRQQPPSTSFTSCAHDGWGEGQELHSLKRKRLTDEDPQTQTPGDNVSLEHVLNKLGKFSKSIQDQRVGKDAKKIAHRISILINAVKQQAAIPGGIKPHDLVSDHSETDFEDIGSCLLVAKRVDVNTGFRRIDRTKLIRVVRKRNTVTFGQWEISLSTSTFESRDESGTEVNESLFSLRLDPRSSSAGSPIKVYFGEHVTHAAASFIHPVVFAYRIIRSDSEVFKLIENDDLDSLKKLLAIGKATLRDCNESNASLLNVS